MQSGAIIKGFDVVEHGGASFSQGAEAIMVNKFVFELRFQFFNTWVALI